MSSSLSTVKDIKASLAKELPIDSLTDESTERCQDMLKRLDDCTMTLEILTETLIGTVVSKFKSHEELGSTAKALVKKWKKLAKEAGVASKSDNNDKKTSKIERQNSSTDTAAAEKLEWDSLPPLRKNICNKLLSLLELSKADLTKSGVNESALTQLLVSRASEIEDAMHDKLGNSKESYTEKARSLCFNIKKNSELREHLLLGATSAEELITMSSDQLATREKAQQRAKMVGKIQDARRLDWEQANEEKINKMCGINGELLQASLFTCGRCKSTKTTSTQKQTRSADEPMTVFVLCLNCGKRWKFS